MIVVPSFSKTKPPSTPPLKPMQLSNGKAVPEDAMPGMMQRHEQVRR